MRRQDRNPNGIQIAHVKAPDMDPRTEIGIIDHEAGDLRHDGVASSRWNGQGAPDAQLSFQECSDQHDDGVEPRRVGVLDSKTSASNPCTRRAQRKSTTTLS
jgi:hypothetical protein